MADQERSGDASPGNTERKQVTLPDISSHKSASPRGSRSGRINKLYRAPPTPTQDLLFGKEKSFVLDSVAVSTMQNDFFQPNPKLGAAILPYNSQRDQHCKNYFYQPSVSKTLKKTGQDNGGNAISGVPQEKFHYIGYLNRYFSARNQHGMGHSLDNICGHHSFMKTSVPITGYNGQFGFRRNTPDLRNTPSPFGIQSRGLPLY